MKNLFCPICEKYSIGPMGEDILDEGNYWLCPECGLTWECGEDCNALLRILCKKTEKRLKQVKDLETENDELRQCITKTEDIKKKLREHIEKFVSREKFKKLLEGK